LKQGFNSNGGVARMTERPKVFGIGLNKTGTKTLNKCLTVLGYTPISCTPDLLKLYRDGNLQPIFAEIDGADSCEDWPYPLMFRELFFRYGDRARYVLTTRISSSIWLDSLKRHSLRTDPNTHCRLLAYGYTYSHGLEKQHIDIYERHNREVRAFFQDHNAKHVLLEVCWENGHGWKALCDFLGRGEPKEPFPHANSGSTQKPGAVEEENRRRIRQQIGLLNPG